MNTPNIISNRILRHVIFWVIYYLAFSLLWANEGDYYQSFGLEFVLMPVRISAAYLTIYYLIPEWLLKDKTAKFLISYGVLILVAGLLQRVFIYFFHELLFGISASPWDVALVIRAMVLVNTTVLFLSSIKMYQYWKVERDKNRQSRQAPFDIRSNKRNYLVDPSDIQYIEGLGNYVTFYLDDRKPLVSYMSLKEVMNRLPGQFTRIHRSFIVNKDWIQSYTTDNVEIAGRILPIGKSVVLEM